MKNKTCKIIFGSYGLIGNELTKKILSGSTFTVSKNFKKNNHFRGNISSRKFIGEIKNSLVQKGYNNFLIFYLSSHSRVKYRKEKTQSISINCIKKLTNVLDVFKDCRAKLILASSGSVYQPLKKKLNEKSKVEPRNFYSAIKLFEENLALEYMRNFNIKVVIARIFSVYAKNAKNFFIHDIKKKLNSTEKKIVFFGSGKQVRDYLYLEDVCSGLNLLAKRGKSGQIYNLCSGKYFKIKNILGAFLNKNNKNNKNNKKIIYWNKLNEFHENDFWYGSNNKIKKLGFKVRKLNLIDFTKI